MCIKPKHASKETEIIHNDHNYEQQSERAEQTEKWNQIIMMKKHVCILQCTKYSTWELWTELIGSAS
jgi:hypothetical protein